MKSHALILAVAAASILPAYHLSAATLKVTQGEYGFISPDNPTTSQTSTYGEQFIYSSTSTTTTTSYSASFGSSTTADDGSGSGGATNAMGDIDGVFNFTVQANPSEAWTFDINLLAQGAMTSVNENKGLGNAQGTFQLQFGDAQVLTSITGNGYNQVGDIPGFGDGGMLDSLPGFSGAPSSEDVPFTLGGSYVLSGTGTLLVQVQFSYDWSMQAQNGLDESLRFGLPGTMAIGEAAAYPGVDSRSESADGIFFDIAEVPEPGSNWALGIGLAGVFAGVRRIGRRGGLSGRGGFEKLRL